MWMNRYFKTVPDEAVLRLTVDRVRHKFLEQRFDTYCILSRRVMQQRGFNYPGNILNRIQLQKSAVMGYCV